MKYRLKWDDVFTYQRFEAVESEKDWIDRARREVIDSAKAGNWSNMLRILNYGSFLKEMTESAPEHHRRCHRLINCTRAGGKAWYAPLHHAAWNGAPRSVVQELLDLGAWRTLRTSRGERPMDIAVRRGHRRLVEILTPECPRPVSEWLIERIEIYFHAVMMGRAARQIKENRLRLPQLSPLLEYLDSTCWCTVGAWPVGFTIGSSSGRTTNQSLCRKAGAEWCKVLENATK